MVPLLPLTILPLTILHAHELHDNPVEHVNDAATVLVVELHPQLDPPLGLVLLTDHHTEVEDVLDEIRLRTVATGPLLKSPMMYNVVVAALHLGHDHHLVGNPEQDLSPPHLLVEASHVHLLDTIYVTEATFVSLLVIELLVSSPPEVNSGLSPQVTDPLYGHNHLEEDHLLENLALNRETLSPATIVYQQRLQSPAHKCSNCNGRNHSARFCLNDRRKSTTIGRDRSNSRRH